MRCALVCGLALIGTGIFFGCAPEGGSQSKGSATLDCRNSGFECGAGFTCREAAEGWSCALVPDMAAESDSSVADMEPTDLGRDMGQDANPEPPGATPGGPCDDLRTCLDGECDEDVPGGFCRVQCESDRDCGDNNTCGSDGLCREPCGADVRCRAGWICDEEEACYPDCRISGCAAEKFCDEETGTCSDVPPCVAEMCNDMDDDCDGITDEGVQNACGTCGEVPEESCNGEDDDCDESIDEGVLNACGDCGDIPEEVCNSRDDDCDGEVDEGVANACGGCADLPADECDGEDNDCDGVIDEDAVCGPQQECREGVCMQRRSNPGGPCALDEDCLFGECLIDPTLPGGLCAVRCGIDDDCGPDAVCAAVQPAVCLEACGQGCRAGWVCYQAEGFCFPDCRFDDCGDYACGNDGFCQIPIVTILVNQVVISPGKSNLDAWDGPGSIPQEALNGAAAALAGPGVAAGALAYAANLANEGFAAPDPYGSAALFLPGLPESRVPLDPIQDTFTPAWAGLEWRDVPLDPEADNRLRIELTDEDFVNHDPIGVVEVSTIDLLAAMRDGGQYGILTDDQGAGQILAISVSVVQQ